MSVQIARKQSSICRLTIYSRYMEKYTINVDWLEVYTKVKGGIPADIKEIGTHTFCAVNENKQTANWGCLQSIYMDKKKVATAVSEPRQSIIPRDTVLVKLENRVLYTKQYISILYDIIDIYNLNYKGITRLDLCYDCNKLHNGRSVKKLIKDFITTGPEDNNHIYRAGSKRWTAYGCKGPSSSSEINGIRFGSRESDRGAYIYNKTLELIEAKNKPWITDLWKRIGLVSEVRVEDLNKMSEKEREKQTEMNSLLSYVKTPVWRFEISLRGHGKDLLNMSTGEIFRLSPDMLVSQQAVERLFYIEAAKIFDFRIKAGHKRIRDYEKLQIFENEPVIECKPYNISRQLDTGRSEKVCYNKLMKLMEEYSYASDTRVRTLATALEFIREIAGVKEDLNEAVGTIRALEAFRQQVRETSIAEKTQKYYEYLHRIGQLRCEIDTQLAYEVFLKGWIEQTEYDDIKKKDEEGILEELPEPINPWEGSYI